MRKFYLMLLVLVGSTGVVAADELRYSGTYTACMQAANSVTVYMVDCMVKESARWDARMSKAYWSLKRGLDKQQGKRFLAAQRAWLKWRQANSVYYSGATGGSIDRITSNQFWLGATVRRALELEELLKTY